MTHPPIYHLDLTNTQKRDVPVDVRTAARTAIWRFAWHILGGDVILVGDSVKRSIIARGFVDCEPGERAYRFNTHDPMTEPNIP